HRPAPTVIYTLSLHDALPISHVGGVRIGREIREIRDEARERGELGELAFEHAAATELELEIRRDRDEVRVAATLAVAVDGALHLDRKSTRLNSSHVKISYAVF